MVRAEASDDSRMCVRLKMIKSIADSSKIVAITLNKVFRCLEQKIYTDVLRGFPLCRLRLNILSGYSNFTGMPPNLLIESGCIMNKLLQRPL